MESFEQKALDNFGSLIINKSFARKAGFGSRAIPVYVREWIVSHYVGDSPDLTDEARARIADFVRRYVPDKGDRETVKNLLYEQNDVKLLDDYQLIDLLGELFYQPDGGRVGQADPQEAGVGCGLLGVLVRDTAGDDADLRVTHLNSVDDPVDGVGILHDPRYRVLDVAVHDGDLRQGLPRHGEQERRQDEPGQHTPAS